MDILDFIDLNGKIKKTPLPEKDTKTDIQGYYKTPQGAIVSKDDVSLKAYKQKKVKDLELSKLKESVSEMKDEISEIKSLLKELINCR